MPRESDILTAFTDAIKFDHITRVRTVSTADFVRLLESYNWHFSMKQANKWIKAHTTTFRDITPDNIQSRLYRQFNPNGGI